MRFGRPRTWIGICSAVAVLALAVVDVAQSSPGPLTQVHGRIPELAGRSGCSACHGGWTRGMTSACLDCHETISNNIEGRQGLHGMLPRDKANQCARCHADHHGEGFAIVNRQSFVQAGFESVEAFDHARIGWPMEGRHAELDCTECHANANAGVLPEGEHRYLGLDNNCATCHEDAHEGRMALSCAQCHGQEDFAELRSVGHERQLPLIGGHADISCRTCHADDGEHSLESLGHGGTRPPSRRCADCHASPHESSFVMGVAKLVQRAPGASCVTCHVPEHTSFLERHLEPGALTVSAELHAASGFPLDAPHDAVSCEECHGPALRPFAGRFRDRSPDRCSACHEDPHGGQFTGGPFMKGEHGMEGEHGPSDCLACHDRLSFEPHTFDAQDHGLTRLALTGSHLELDCEACHLRPTPDAPRVFQGTAITCGACHRDAHEGFFAQHVRDLATQNGICAGCHGTTDFSELPPEGFDHHRFTEFPLDGAHAQEACETCHVRADEPDLFGRTFGRITEVFGRVEGCNTCHEDPHRGEFDAPGLPRQVNGRAGCARCHTTTSFRALASDWDHRRWTGFSLEGAHGDVSCSTCHEPVNDPGPLGRTWERAVGSNCADCHEEPHRGQFAVAGVTRCNRCHESAQGWDVLRFNHDLESRFPLSAAHKQVACASCHRPTDPEDEASPIRYRPLKTQCVDCHGTHDGPALKRTGK